MKKATILFMLAVGMLAGCESYELKMAVKDGKLHREFTVQGEASKPKESVHTESIVGEVKGQFDNTVFFDMKICPLGTSYVYVEDSGGSYDTAEQLKTVQSAADNLIPLIRTWARIKYSKLEGYEKLDEFLNTTFRKDLADLAIMIFLFVSDSQLEVTPDDTFANIVKLPRIGQIGMFLSKRGYIDQNKFFMIISDNWEIGLSREALAAKTGLKGKILDELVNDTSGIDKLLKDFKKTLETSDEYKRFAANFIKKHKTKAPATQPTSKPQVKPVKDIDNDEIFLEYIDNKLKIRSYIFENNTKISPLKISLALVSPPARTNGKWNEKLSRIEWVGRLVTEGNVKSHIPQTRYAIWAIPDVEYQKKHYGKVLVDSDKLVSFVGFYLNLPADAKKQCDELLEALTPENYVDRIKAFKFSAPHEKLTFPVWDFGIVPTGSPDTKPTSKPAKRRRRSRVPQVMKFYDVETKEIITIDPKTSDPGRFSAGPGMKYNNPKTGKYTLVPMMYCPSCKKWFVTDEMLKKDGMSTMLNKPLVCTHCGLNINEYYRQKRRSRKMKNNN